MAVFVGLCVLDVLIPESRSLKEKRQQVKSLLDRIRDRFPVSACEADHLDDHKRSQIAFASVANGKDAVHRSLMNLVEFVEKDGRFVIENVSVEIW
ncbi:MAG: DUF503 domain-containing protein [Armatimonadetes bacterium]|nr:DUF503 domain-containing protein [Armatimonadota bacterium]MDW8122343.1 DUF503 domain-containing protein [Armatimonadota bacterium]